MHNRIRCPHRLPFGKGGIVILEDWEKHVKKSDGEHGNIISYCGEILFPCFHLVNKEHAKACVETDNRIQPCPECWKVINE
jgi:hypothetical protein